MGEEVEYNHLSLSNRSEPSLSLYLIPCVSFFLFYFYFFLFSLIEHLDYWTKRARATFEQNDKTPFY